MDLMRFTPALTGLIATTLLALTPAVAAAQPGGDPFGIPSVVRQYELRGLELSGPTRCSVSTPRWQEKLLAAEQPMQAPAGPGLPAPGPPPRRLRTCAQAERWLRSQEMGANGSHYLECKAECVEKVVNVPAELAQERAKIRATDYSQVAGYGNCATVYLPDPYVKGRNDWAFVLKRVHGRWLVDDVNREVVWF